jgi:diguanylate cyclase (GGDEF)-like protein/PAS domain S-box-containing protein
MARLAPGKVEAPPDPIGEQSMTDDARNEAPAIEREQEYDPQAVSRQAPMGRGGERDRLSQIIAGNPVPTFVIDEHHRVTHWNKACETIFGVPAAGMIGTRRQRQIFYGTDRPCMADLIVQGAGEELFRHYYGDKYRKSVLIDGAYEAEDYFPNFHGGQHWLFFTAAPLFDPAGRIVGAVETLQDVTDAKRAETALHTSERRFRDLFETMSDGVVIFEPQEDGADFVVADMNPAAESLCRLTRDRMVGKRLGEAASSPAQVGLVSVEAAVEMADTVQRVWRTGMPESRFSVHHDGGGKPLDCRYNHYIRLPTGEIACLSEDVTERERNQAELEMAASVFRHTVEGIFVTDPQGVIVSINPAFTHITGFEESEALGQTPRLLRSGMQDEDFFDTLWDTLKREGNWQGEIWNRRKNGEIFLEWATITQVLDAAGRPSRYVAIFNDITDLHRKDEQIKHQAYHDALTGLPNRLLLSKRIEHGIAFARRNNHGIALLFIDLDHFKTVNDFLGHDMGDKLLVEVARRLKSCVRDSDTVARLGGDEFIVVICDTSVSESVSQVCHRILKSLRTPFAEPEVDAVTASIGISLFPDNGEDADTLLKHADIAMYESKRRSRNTISFFTSDMTAKMMRRLELESDLRRAIDNDELEVHYQPKANIADCEIYGMEALLRWHHPTRGTVPPDEFIPLAEEIGMIVPIGEWVLRTACRDVVSLQAAGIRLHLSVNLSMQQFRDPDLVARIAAILSETGLEPDRLELELTETIIMTETNQSIAALNQIKRLGVALSIDDFGTGYSSLSYLTKLPIDTLKIDRSFIQHCGHDGNSATVVSAIINLASQLGHSVVAEGVETVAQLSFLRERKCSMIQGYLLSRPVPLAAFVAQLGRWRKIVVALASPIG